MKSKKKLEKVKDPFAAREAENYDNPIPSREYILKLLEKAGEPLEFDIIAKKCRLHDDDEQLEALSRRLKAMCRDSQILRSRRNRYGLIDRMALIAGTVQGHRDGHGFVIPDEGGDSYFLMPRDMRKVIHGDHVLVAPEQGSIRGKRIARLVEVTQHKKHLIVGRYFQQGSLGFVEPDNQRITQRIVIAPENTLKAQEGQVVLTEIITPPNRHSPPTGIIVEVLGDYLAPGMETDIAVRSHSLPFEFSEENLLDISTLSDSVQKKDCKNREDLRDLPFVTIDGSDAKDFDDAIYCEPKARGGWQLWVAIADVSYYVKPKTACDEDALERGNSVYFPNRVIPMLPEKLSNGLCSLMPKVDRLAMVCHMQITAEGKMTHFEFYPAVIHSHARLTYDQVANMVEHNDQSARQKFKHVVEHCDTLYTLYKKLHYYRMHSGSLYFDIPSVSFRFDKKQKLKDLVPQVRNDAHGMVEECMLCANVAAAKFILKHKTPGVYRVHPGPKPDKISELQSFLKSLGLQLNGGLEPEPADYAELVANVEGRPDSGIVYMQLLRSLMQAYYTVEDGLHFGLAFEAYTHFTSPIRRYPDLLVHRIIKNILDNTKPTYSANALTRMAQHCSQTERRADEATRSVDAWLKCEFMASKVGDEFEAVINSVCGFGFFVELRDTLIDGLVHISTLENDYYRFDEQRLCLIGERTHHAYHLGDKIRVRLMRVSLEDRQIDFELVTKKTIKKKKRRRK